MSVFFFIEGITNSYGMNSYEMNLANRNATLLLSAAALPAAAEGIVEVANIPFVISNIETRLASDVSKFTVETVRKDNFVNFGADEEYIRHRLEELKKLLERALALNKRVLWY